MARKRKHSRRRFIHRSMAPRRSNKFTVRKGLQTVIALAPVTMKAANAYNANGGGVNGLVHGALPAVTEAYIGYNTNENRFYPEHLVEGWVPLLGAYLFGKLTKRIRVLDMGF